MPSSYSGGGGGSVGGGSTVNQAIIENIAAVEGQGQYTLNGVPSTPSEVVVEVENEATLIYGDAYTISSNVLTLSAEVVAGLVTGSTIRVIYYVTDISGVNEDIESLTNAVATDVTDFSDWHFLVRNAEDSPAVSRDMVGTELAKALDVVLKKDTVADMLALTGVPDGTRVDTARYSTSHTVGDGSGGEYVYDADSTATIDGGFVMPGPGGTLSFSGTTFNGNAGTGGRWLLKDTSVAISGQFGDRLQIALLSSSKVVLSSDVTITSALQMGTRNHLDLQKHTITQATANTPIITVDRDTYNSMWTIENGRLAYATQQGASDTNSVAIRLAWTSKTAFLGTIRDIDIARAYHGIYVPEQPSTFAFLVTMRNVYISDSYDYAVKWYGDFANGAHTNVVLDNVWAHNASDGTTGKGFAFASINGLNIKNAGCDRLKNTHALRVVSCQGTIDVFWTEVLELSYGSGVKQAIQFTDSIMDVGTIYTYANDITLTGTADFYFLRADTNSKITVNRINEHSLTVSDTSSGYYYQALPDATSYLSNESFESNYAAPAPFGFGENAYRVTRWNGSDRQVTKGGQIHTYRTAAPTSGAWTVGDICWNIEPAAGGTIGWVCTTAGSPGTWKTFGSIAP